MSTETKKARVVLDTNVLISGILWDGKPADIIRKAENGEISIVISWFILEELEEVLKRPYFENKFGDMDNKVREISVKLIQISEGPITTDSDLDIIEEDVSDNKILECALEAEVDFLISGDDHLLGLSNYGDIKIIDARSFLEKINEKGEE